MKNTSFSRRLLCLAITASCISLPARSEYSDFGEIAKLKNGYWECNNGVSGLEAKTMSLHWASSQGWARMRKKPGTFAGFAGGQIFLPNNWAAISSMPDLEKEILSDRLLKSRQTSKNSYSLTGKKRIYSKFYKDTVDAIGFRFENPEGKKLELQIKILTNDGTIKDSNGNVFAMSTVSFPYALQRQKRYGTLVLCTNNPKIMIVRILKVIRPKVKDKYGKLKDSTPLFMSLSLAYNTLSLRAEQGPSF